MVVNPSIVKATQGMSMLAPKKLQGDSRSTQRQNKPQASYHLPYPPPHQPRFKLMGYTLMTLGSKRVDDGGRARICPIREYGHRLVIAFCFGPSPSKDYDSIIHTCHQGVGCHQPHHMLYGTKADNNLRGRKAIRRYKQLAEEQGRIYYGMGEDVDDFGDSDDDY